MPGSVPTETKKVKGHPLLPKNTFSRLSSRARRRRIARLNARRGPSRPITPFLLFALAIGLGLPAHSATDSYSGPDSGDYGTAANWNNGAGPVPGQGNTDNAVNTTLNAINFNTNATINSFTGTNDGAFTVAGGTLSGSQASAASTFSNGNTTNVNGGTLSNLTFNEGSSGGNNFGLTFNNNNTLSGVIINSTAALGSGQTNVDQTETFAGAATLAGGTLRLGDDGNVATLNVSKTGTLTGYGLVNNYAGSTLANSGTIDANSSGKTLTLNVQTFNDTGTAEATGGGTLTLNDGTDNDSGAVKAAGVGSVVNIQGENLILSGSNSFQATGGGAINVFSSNVSGTLAATSGSGVTFVSASGQDSLSNVTLAAGTLAAFDSGQTNLNQTETLAGTATLAGGTLRLGNDGNAATLDLTGTLSGSGLVNNYAGSTLTNDGYIAANTAGSPLTLNVTTLNNKADGTLEAIGGATLTLDSGTDTEAGTLLASGAGSVVNIQGENLVLSGSNSFQAVSGGTISIAGSSVSGTLNATGADGVTFASASGQDSLSNVTLAAGTLAAFDSGQTNLNQTETLAGAATLAGGTLRLGNDGNAATLDLTGTLSGSGLVNNYAGSTLTNAGTLEATGGTPAASAALNVNVSAYQDTTASVAEATSNSPLVFSDSTNTLSGTVHAAGGNVTFNGGSLTSNASAQYLADPTDTISLQGVSLFGTVGKTSGSGLTFASASSQNNVDGATFDAGTVEAFDSGQTNVNGTNVFGGMATLGGGTLRLGNDGNPASVDLTGTLSGSGTINNYAGSTLTNDGTLNANDSVNALNVNVQTFTNNAMAEATGAGGLVLNEAQVNNNATGKISANGGNVTIENGTLTSAAGSVYAATGGTISVTSEALTGEIGSATGSGLTLASASGQDNLDSLTFDSGTLAFDSGQTNVNGTDTLGGTDTLAGGTLRLGNDGNAATLNVTGSLSGNGTVNNYAGSTLANSGTIDASGGTLSITPNTLTNTGTLQAENGATLSVTSNTTDNGSILVKTGGTETFSQAQGLTQTTGKTQVDGTLNVASFTLAGGLLDGTGTVNSGVNNTGGTVKAGDSPGTLTIAGDYTQAAGPKATLLDEIASFTAPNYGLLDVTGNATFAAGSILDVSLINGFMPDNSSIGTIIPFLDYGTLDANALTNLSADSLNNGYSYQIINQMTAGAASGDLALVITNAPAPTPPAPAVPEPSSLALLGLGGFALVGVARRRRTGASL